MFAAALTAPLDLYDWQFVHGADVDHDDGPSLAKLMVDPQDDIIELLREHDYKTVVAREAFFQYTLHWDWHIWLLKSYCKLASDDKAAIPDLRHTPLDVESDSEHHGAEPGAFYTLAGIDRRLKENLVDIDRWKGLYLQVIPTVPAHRQRNCSAPPDALK